MTNYAASVPCTTDALKGFDRVKVDPGQTSFFEGREFRTFKELSISSGGSYTLKAVVPNDIILTGLAVEVETGQLRVATVVGGTPAGTYGETLPIFPRNNMSVGPNRRANVAPEVVITAGGTHTGGTELDVLRVKTALNQGVSFSSSVGSAAGDERGVGANTYHFRLVAAVGDPVVGVIRVSWEERRPIA